MILKLKHDKDVNFKVPSERTIYRIMEVLNLSHRPKRNPNGITKAFYCRKIKSTTFTVEELKIIIWRYFISYWNNRRICSANDGLPPMVRRKRYYASLEDVA